ncbi:MAG: hypothetical protein ACRDKW_18465, partial [Actinomycetota bacterium]
VGAGSAPRVIGAQMQVTVDVRSLTHPALQGGGMIVIGGRVARVPPDGPEHRLVELVARYLGTGMEGDTLGPPLRRTLLADIIGAVLDLDEGPRFT